MLSRGVCAVHGIMLPSGFASCYTLTANSIRFITLTCDSCFVHVAHDSSTVRHSGRLLFCYKNGHYRTNMT